MLTEQEKAHLLRLARQSHQSRRDATGAAPARIAWAYDLLDEAAAAQAATTPIEPDPVIPPRSAGRFALALARMVESPLRVTLWAGGVAAILFAGALLVDHLHMFGVNRPMASVIDDGIAWFPADLIAAALLVFGLAAAARWAVLGALGSLYPTSRPSRDSGKE